MIDKVLPYTATLADYAHQADAIHAAVHRRPEKWRIGLKWSLPRYRDKAVAEVDPSTVDRDDARHVVAGHYHFDSWDDLAAFTETMAADSAARMFEAAADAVVAGDVAALRALLDANSSLIGARSRRRHHATLLHYVAANGVEDWRQKTPANAVDVARTLLDAGAEVDAVADMYGEQCTVMSMLCSSEHPAKAGVQAALAETLLDYGAAIEGAGSKWRSAVETALAFGYLDTARTLVGRGAPVRLLATAAGLGLRDVVAERLPSATAGDRHAALALAAQLGHAEVVGMLLDAGQSPDALNPEGHHAHSTPLHQAALAGHRAVVELLVSRGARLDLIDTIYRGTPLDWAIHGGQREIAAYLRSHGAPST